VSYHFALICLMLLCSPCHGAPGVAKSVGCLMAGYGAARQRFHSSQVQTVFLGHHVKINSGSNSLLSMRYHGGRGAVLPLPRDVVTVVTSVTPRILMWIDCKWGLTMASSRSLQRSVSHVYILCKLYFKCDYVNIYYILVLSIGDCLGVPRRHFSRGFLTWTASLTSAPKRAVWIKTLDIV
jgi:hypothetical protein